jgi:predicted dehydrogenase
MLAALAPDICIVATGGYEYGSEHYEPTMQALDYGCHVLGEKPISNTIREAEEMVALARRKGSATASTSTTVSPRRRAWPSAGKTKAAWVTCSSST